MNNLFAKISFGILFPAIIAGFFACAEKKYSVKWHPEEFEKKPVCSECHEDDLTALDHTDDFITRHKFYSSQQQQTCSVCHKQSFCADCHANEEEIKPSDKYKDSPERALPHRGDYITQHQIDGKINPASCFKCHGRQNNRECKRCHR
jgi:hypothetical protein